MDWFDLLPVPVAIMQTAWDRRQLVGRMVEAGLTCREIGRRLGVSAGRAWQLRQEWMRRRSEPSPVERYGRTSGAIAALADRVIYTTVRDPRGYQVRVRREGVWPTMFFKQTLGRADYRESWWDDSL